MLGLVHLYQLTWALHQAGRRPRQHAANSFSPSLSSPLFAALKLLEKRLLAPEPGAKSSQKQPRAAKRIKKEHTPKQLNINNINNIRLLLRLLAINKKNRSLAELSEALDAGDWSDRRYR